MQEGVARQFVRMLSQIDTYATEMPGQISDTTNEPCSSHDQRYAHSQKDMSPKETGLGTSLKSLSPAAEGSGEVPRKRTGSFSEIIGGPRAKRRPGGAQQGEGKESGQHKGPQTGHNK